MTRVFDGFAVRVCLDDSRLVKRRQALWGHNLLRDSQLDGASMDEPERSESDFRTLILRDTGWYSPLLIRLDQRIEDRQELSHGCGQGDLFGFSICQQTLVEGLDGAVPARGRKRGHVQHGTHCRTTSGRLSFADGFS